MEATKACLIRAVRATLDALLSLWTTRRRFVARRVVFFFVGAGFFWADFFVRVLLDLDLPDCVVVAVEEEED